MSSPANCTIRVDPRFLTNLSSRLDQTAHDLRTYSNHGSGNLSSAPGVQAKYDELGRRWDFNRDNLADQLTALARAFREARDAFVDADLELAGAFDGGTSAVS